MFHDTLEIVQSIRHCHQKSNSKSNGKFTNPTFEINFFVFKIKKLIDPVSIYIKFI